MPKQKTATLSITNKTLKLDSPYIVYQIRNIASVDKRVQKPSYKFSVCAIVVFFPLGIFFVLQYNSLTSIGLILIILSIIGILERMMKKNLYGVNISTTDAKSVSIWSRSEDFIVDIISKLYEVMENQDIPISYNFKIEGDMVQQSGNFGTGYNRGTIN